MKSAINILLLVLISVCTSCQKSFDTKEELATYIQSEKSGLSSNITRNSIRIALTYMPYKIQFANHEEDDTLKRSKADSKRFFVLSLSKEGKEILSQLNRAMYSNLTRVFSFSMVNNIFISTPAGQKGEADDCFFQPTYGMSNANELLVIFKDDKVPKEGTFNVVVREFGLGLGELVFPFKAKDIQHIEEAKYNF
jgi:hypothetical protein